jgi:hypothetical protein
MGICNFWKKWKKAVWTIIAFLIPYLLTWFLFSHIGYPMRNEEIKHLTCEEAFYRAITEPLAAIIAFILSICTAIYQFSKEHNKEQEELIKKLDEKVDAVLNRSKIVFESGINEFDDRHLLALYRVLNKLENEQKPIKGHMQPKIINIYAIDNSDPRTWWSDTMIGYLALLSKYRPGINVHRIFVCQKNELLSPIFVKTVGLHSLMGMKTYVIEYDQYKKVLDSLGYKKYNIKKEVFIWTQGEQNPKNLGDPFEIDFKSDELKCSHIKCYQSFWDIDSEYHVRQNLQDGNKNCDSLKTYYGRVIEPEHVKKIKIWFEFIGKEKVDDMSNPPKNDAWDELPRKYLDLIARLLTKMVCCKNESEVVINSKYYGIEIRTGNCRKKKKCSIRYCPSHIERSCINKVPDSGFEFTAMSNVKVILQTYYKAISRKS